VRTELLARILETPSLAVVVPRLPPEVLHRVIETCGLEDCGELVALATPRQLQRVFDLDLWHAPQPGVEERFDANRFGVWLEVLVDCGAAVAAQKLAAMDVGLVIGGLAAHVRVVDPSVRALGDRLSCDIGGYLVGPLRADSWDAIVSALVALNEEHPDCFHRVMRGCRRLSNSKPEIDGLHVLLTDRQQLMFDLAVDRERRREASGYVAPAQARAFLQLSRQPRSADVLPPDDPLARAYFRAIEWETTPRDGGHLSPEPEESGVAAVVEVLVEAGVLPQPRGLLSGSQEQATRLTPIQTHMQCVLERDPQAYSTRCDELGFLANAIAAGCSVQARPLTAKEAADAAAAICNLGLENISTAGTALPDDFLAAHDLVGVFQAGWAALYHDVCMYAAERLIAVLTHLQCEDRETRLALNVLRIELTKHWKAGEPWRARASMDVLAILDMPAWAALLALIDECPVIHAGLHASLASQTTAVSASAFEFIAENSQIASVRSFMRSLPDTLRG
jgi:uncharacterized protein DUF6178